MHARSTLDLPPLPIDACLDDVRAAMASHRAAVITAAPGAGKTTRVPPALVDAGPVLVLQPRRVAARSIARRIADERGWQVGGEVGWHVRGDRRFSAETRLLIATEGILTATLQQDPLAARFTTIVIDEFHERSIHADLGLTLAREAWKARDDLRLVVMSATIDAGAVAAYLGGCPVIAAAGREVPLDVSYHPAATLADGVRVLLPPRGAVLCFLAGAPEIRRAAAELAAAGVGAPVLPLHGGLDPDEQDAALQPSDTARIILATNLAETTVTVPDVVAVVDTGWHKVARYDATRAIDSLTLERVSQDSADQRAGRAGRVQAGRAWRLWDARDRLRRHREPEIARVDLAATVLAVAAWGGQAGDLEWLDGPPVDALDAAIALLRRLGALDEAGKLNPVGERLARLPIHPRLGRILLEGGGDRQLARACALLSERQTFINRQGATSCDLLSAVDRESALPPHVLAAARDIETRAAQALGEFTRRSPLSDSGFRRAILAGYPDRVARRRQTGSDRFQLASGAGARLARESGVVNHELIVAVDVTAAAPAGGEALIRMATGLEPEWIQPVSSAIEHEIDDSGTVRAARVERYDALVVAKHAVAPVPEATEPLLVAARRERGPQPRDAALLNRLSFAGIDITFHDLAERATVGHGHVSIDAIDLFTGLSVTERQQLERLAPARLLVPSGREAALDYREGQVFAAVKLQELFGLADSPRIGRNQIPVTFELLSPAGRPVQVTRDLRSFWNKGYQDVRRELRARYPRHPWPDDPWTAPPTRRALPRKPH